MTLTERLFANDKVVAHTRQGYPVLTRRGLAANVLTLGHLGQMVERARDAKAAQDLGNYLKDLDITSLNYKVDPNHWDL